MQENTSPENTSSRKPAAYDLLASLQQVRNGPLQPGTRWVYSAGFNVLRQMSDTARVDEEIPDLRLLVRTGCRVSILSHQGSHSDGTAMHLQGVAEYLSGRLATPVAYHPDNASAASVDASHALRNGQVALFGNTRFHPGEEMNDPELARQFANFGEVAAIGGFCKAHRRHASNVGILAFRRGFAASGAVEEAMTLAPWAAPRAAPFSIAVLGGTKGEKITLGLRGLCAAYDCLIPGGAVLNSILAAKGCSVADSVVCRGARETVCEILENPHAAKIMLPEVVIAARPRVGGGYDTIRTSPRAGIPQGFGIVDFELTDAMRGALAQLERVSGRMLMAGPPSLAKEGFIAASSELLAAMHRPGVAAILLGGDSVAELPFAGARSTGGGSALQFIATGTTTVFSELSLASRQARDDAI
jgi:phosphoglycerate kinase